MSTNSVRSLDRLVMIVPACTASLEPQKPPASGTPVPEYWTDPVTGRTCATRDNGRRVGTHVIWRALELMVLMFAMAGTVSAQQDSADSRPSPGVLADAGFDAVLRWNGGVRILLAKADDYPAKWSRSGLLVAASIGQGGFRLGAGVGGLSTHSHSVFGDILATDVSAVLTRTSMDPRVGSPQSTYVGAEAGLTFIMVRLAMGLQQRVSGTGKDATLKQWTVGLELMLHR